ncbi:hypothetical protein [Klebsiella pneumoniae]|uniref:hypothetical protein n=1 Tax=Klebsiella pneumoniae TaxID=573 RepID=UPI002175EB22|nr:hypothetical protein [Klebsiella pneumoniae]
MFAGKKSAQIREILISESAWEEMTCLFAPSLMKRSGMAGKNLLRKALPSPGQQDGLCLSQPRRMDSNG